MINLGQVLGRVGKIDTRTTSTGVKVCQMSLVTSKKLLKNGVRTEKVTWHNVTLFNKVADIAEKYVTIGDLLYIQGEMDNQKFTGQDGVERTKSFIIAYEIKLMPKSKEHPAAPKENNYQDGVENAQVPW